MTQRREADRAEIPSGVFEGKTTGTPICLLIRNTDQRSKDYGNIVETFRPGHADYTYWQKYGIRDRRGGGRSSARLTAPVVAAGAVAKKWLREQYGTEIRGYLSQLGEIEVPFVDWSQVGENPFFVPNADIVPELETYMDALRRDGDSGRRAHRGGGQPKAGRPGRALVRQARCRHRLCADGHQRGQGCRSAPASTASRSAAASTATN